MNRLIAFFLIALFSVFVGTQLTEGCLLLPYWKSLSSDSFYEYYSTFGPVIGQFYTILTIIAALVPILTSVYCFLKKSPALKYSLISSFLAITFIAFFYIYFKDANQQFYNASLDAKQLKQELEIWGYWHWVRIFIEFLSLIFLILSFNILVSKKTE